MKVTQLSAFLGLLAVSVAAQDTTTTTDVAVVAALQPEADGTVNGAGDFPVPVEMVQKRSLRAEPVKGSSNLTKRHYGTFTCVFHYWAFATHSLLIYVFSLSAGVPQVSITTASSSSAKTVSEV
jgi:hypothetical protein